MVAALAKVWDVLADLGLLLLTDRKFPSVATIVAGSPVSGSWWSHPKGSEIFEVSESLSEHEDVIATKLLSGKVTFVHRRLWPALRTLGTSGEPWQLRGLSPSARDLLGYVMRRGTVRTDELPTRLRPRGRSSGDDVRSLERRLLLCADEVHTESGAHAKVLESWAAWARRSGASKPRGSSAIAKEELERVVDRINEKFGANARLPWL